MRFDWSLRVVFGLVGVAGLAVAVGCGPNEKVVPVAAPVPGQEYRGGGPPVLPDTGEGRGPKPDTVEPEAQKRVTRETPLGKATVEAPGFEMIARANQSRPAIRVRVELENERVAILALESARMDLRANGRVTPFLAPTIVDGPREVPPKESRNVDLWYALPEGVSQDAVEGFQIRLRVAAPGGESDDEVIEFVRAGDRFVSGR